MVQVGKMIEWGCSKCSPLNKRRIINMKKFGVIVYYEGAINYEVEAQTEDEARQIAEKMFGDESDSIIAAEIADCGVCDCWEIKEEL